MSLSSYEDIGFNSFLERPIGSDGVVSSSPDGGANINFDNSQTSGSLGDKIQVGGDGVIIDGTNKRIFVANPNGGGISIDGSNRTITVNNGNTDVIKIDGQAGNLIVNDGSNDIILIGFQEGGF